MSNYVAIDIGGTAIKYGIVNERGEIFEKREMATEAQKGGPALLEKVLGIVQKYQEAMSLTGVGISTAGMVNSDTGEIFFASPAIPNYKGINYKKSIQTRFDLPCEVENDVNCAGLAESMAGAARNAKVALVLTVGTGVGGCLILDRRVYTGFSYSACEVGYMQMNGAKFEDLASTSALVRRVATAKSEPVDAWNGKKIFQAAANGDCVCVEAIDNMTDLLGRGIANICYVLNPEIVVLGGGIMAQQEVLEPKLNAALDKYLVESLRSKLHLAFAELQNSAGMLGAYFNFRNKHL